MSAIEENKAVVRQFFEAASQGDLEKMLACWADNCINHARFNEDHIRYNANQGKERLQKTFVSLLTAFPDRQWKIKDLIAEGDKVVCRLIISGTHQGVPQLPIEGGLLLQAIIPQGKTYSVQHVHIFRIENGQIAEHWAARDDLGQLEQLGGLTFPTQKLA